MYATWLGRQGGGQEVVQCTSMQRSPKPSTGSPGEWLLKHQYHTWTEDGFMLAAKFQLRETWGSSLRFSREPNKRQQDAMLADSGKLVSRSWDCLVSSKICQELVSEITNRTLPHCSAPLQWTRRLCSPKFFVYVPHASWQRCHTFRTLFSESSESPQTPHSRSSVMSEHTTKLQGSSSGFSLRLQSL